MPKLSKGGENSKAVEAKQRKASALKAEQEKKSKAAEDAAWADDDKHIAKKQSRKDDKEKKRLETLERKTANKLLAEEEVSSIVVTKSQPASKVTQAQIAAEREKREAAARKAAAAASGPVKAPKPAPLLENLNRERPPDEEANTVDEALKMLSLDDGALTADRHPERRVKAAYSAFEEIRLPELKAENPSLRLTQLKQLLYTEWQKSPDNPLNKEKLAYNTKT